MKFKIIFHRTKAGYVACYIDAVYKRFYIDVQLGLTLTNLSYKDITFIDEPIVRMIGAVEND